jgi:prepilin peptidase CpaA
MSATVANIISLAGLAAMLAFATAHDIRSRRIPNAVVALGMLAGAAVALSPGGIGIDRAAAGIVGGLLAFMPLHLLRLMGAGDVKLMSAVGAFVGWPGAVVIAVYALVAGGLISIGVAIAGRDKWRAFAGAPSRPDRLRVPFAAAIAAGAAAHIYIAGLG